MKINEKISHFQFNCVSLSFFIRIFNMINIHKLNGMDWMYEYILVADSPHNRIQSLSLTLLSVSRIWDSMCKKELWDMFWYVKLHIRSHTSFSLGWNFEENFSFKILKRETSFGKIIAWKLSFIKLIDQ